MRPKVFGILLLIAVGVAFVLMRKDKLHQKTGFSQYKPFASQISKCNEVNLYEGLPHQEWEHEQFQSELTNKAITILAEFPFYSEPLPLSANDAKLLREIYCDSSAFLPFIIGKACGGYHPDYCIKWSDGTNAFLVQICFGCGEMMTFSEGKILHCNIKPRAQERFGKILKLYRKNRPEKRS